METYYWYSVVDWIGSHNQSVTSPTLLPVTLSISKQVIWCGFPIHFDLRRNVCLDDRGLLTQLRKRSLPVCHSLESEFPDRKRPRLVNPGREFRARGLQETLPRPK